jgi:hypothetical protein
MFLLGCRNSVLNESCGDCSKSYDVEFSDCYWDSVRKKLETAINSIYEIMADDDKLVKLTNKYKKY